MKRRWSLRWPARFVAPFEGYRSTAYQDSGGVWTIAYGRTSGVYPGQTTNRAQALRWLAQDLREASAAVKRNVRVKLTVRERIATISFVFNVGEGGLQSSTFLRELNAGNKRRAADALRLWVKDAAGNTLLGLQRRRAAERWLFIHPRKDHR